MGGGGPERERRGLIVYSRCGLGGRSAAAGVATVGIGLAVKRR